MGSDWHRGAIFEAYGVLNDQAIERAAKGEPPWYVSSQVTVITKLPRRRRLWQPKPDVFVVVGHQVAPRTSYDTRRDGPMPQFILEIASDSTWENDVDDKLTCYGLLGVAEYVVFDPVGEILPEPIQAWQRGSTGLDSWQPLQRADGTPFWRSNVLGLDLRIEGPLLRFVDPAKGPLPLHRELHGNWQDAEQRVWEERQAREAAEKRAQAAERELAALREQIRKELR